MPMTYNPFDKYGNPKEFADMTVQDFEMIERENDLNSFKEIINKLNSSLSQYIYLINASAENDDLPERVQMKIEAYQQNILFWKDELEKWYQLYSAHYTVDELVSTVQQSENSLIINDLLRNFQVVNYFIMER
jgi:hypothetical protein